MLLCNDGWIQRVHRCELNSQRTPEAHTGHINKAAQPNDQRPIWEHSLTDNDHTIADNLVHSISSSTGFI